MPEAAEAEITQPASIESRFDESGESFFYRITQLEVVKVAILGLVVGILLPLLSYLIQRFFVGPVFCQSGDMFGLCGAQSMTVYSVLTVFLSAIATVLLVNWQVFRPLLIAVASAAALWGFSQAVSAVAAHSWLEYGALSAAVFMCTYMLFYWLMRVRSFVVSVLLTVVAVLAIRWLLLA